MNKKIISIILIIVISLFSLTACGDGDENAGGNGKDSSGTFELVEGSGATMTAALADAYKNKEWVVVTGWTPHWKFAKFDLKYLKDPKGVFGEEEHISTIARKGLKNDMPEVYEFLDNFKWTPDEMAELMVSNQEKGGKAYDNAKIWMRDNEDRVKEWLPADFSDGNGEEVELLYVEWSSEIASTNLVAAVLQEKMGYDVKLTPVSAAAMWTGIAEGDGDAMVAAWLESTHGHYLDKVKDKVDNLGPNLEGTKLGLVVPSYVTIDSIDEMKSQAKKFDGKIIGIDPGAGLMKMTKECIDEYELDKE